MAHMACSLEADAGQGLAGLRTRSFDVAPGPQKHVK